MRIAIIIPARYGSRRFPGKPLAKIKGVSLLERVWAIARAVDGIAQVLVATEDPRVVNHARAFGATAMLTPESCRTGTERVHAAAHALDPAPEAVINLQGDAVLTPPWVVQALAEALRGDPGVRVVTPAVRLSAEEAEALAAAKRADPAGGTLVVFDRDHDALYFSKAMIPFRRETGPQAAPVHRHVGLYGYALGALDALAALAPSPLETAEGLEQLRALENGIPVRVVVVDYRGRTHWSVDSPDDVARVERLIERHGELVAVA